MTGWAPALRIARRELLRAKGRTLLVLVMVLLPVVGVVTLSTLLRTADVDVVEGLPHNLGSAQARLDVMGGRVEQDAFLRTVGSYEPSVRPTTEQVRAALPEGSRLLDVREGPAQVPLVVDGRRLRVSPIGVDLTEPSARGPFSLIEGRAPATPQEIAVTPDLRADGVRPGDRVELAGGVKTVTGTVGYPREHGYVRAVYGTPAAVELGETYVSRYWVSGPEVTWADVQQLNAIGVAVLSRAVVLDPPSTQALPADVYVDDGRAVTLAVIALIAVMAVLEVVLLAGPAFAVGARRQRRTLALLAATGGEPAHVRRVVLSQGLLVGIVAVTVGLPLGLAVAALARAPISRFTDAEWGPFDVAPLDLLLVAVLGAGTALLAALFPAVVMARQPVVAALHGRRLTSASAARPALLGLVLLGAGLLLTFLALQTSSPFGGYAELGVAAAAIPTVLGAVLLAPAALSAVGRLAGRLPLPLRFAVRDADRQRGRTAPAVAAIAATVAGVVALGTGASSDAAEQRLTYRPSGPPGAAVVAAYGGNLDIDWAAVQTAAREAVPGEPVQPVRGLPRPEYGMSPSGFSEVQICRVGEQPPDSRCSELYGDHGSAYGSDLLVGEAALDLARSDADPGAATAAEQVLRDGGVLLAVPALEPGTQVELRLTRFVLGPDGGERAEVLEVVTAPAAQLPMRDGFAPMRAVLSDRVAQDLGEPTTVGLVVGNGLSRAEEAELRRSVRGVDEALDVAVERGYSADDDRTVLLVLSLVAGTLVLGGSLAATSLALSEARPDLATLGQVGARPRTRRAVAGGYALVLALVGAALGVAAGLVPGVAVAVPLTRNLGSSGLPGSAPRPDHVVDLPFTLLLVVLVVLPLVAAAVAAAGARGGSAGAHRVPA